MNTLPVVVAKGLTKSYGDRRVVDGIDFEIFPGECFGFLGPNGAGKSTTLRMIIGLTPIDAGTLEVFGQPMFPERTDAAQRMGVVPQEDNLDTDLSVGENLLIYGRYFGLSRLCIQDRIEQLLDFAQLSDRRHTPVRGLSGGMMRRLVIARALVANPEMVVLDEPTTGLDPQARHLIWQRLRTLRDTGATLLLTTHYMEEAAQLCNRLLILNQGVILEQGSPRELIARHVEPEVVEIRGVDAPPNIQEFTGLPGRLELVGDTLYCYSHDAAQVLEVIRHRRDMAYLVRPANLEDVFLELTGRDLRE